MANSVFDKYLREDETPVPTVASVVAPQGTSIFDAYLNEPEATMSIPQMQEEASVFDEYLRGTEPAVAPQEGQPSVFDEYLREPATEPSLAAQRQQEEARVGAGGLIQPPPTPTPVTLEPTEAEEEQSVASNIVKSFKAGQENWRISQAGHRAMMSLDFVELPAAVREFRRFADKAGQIPRGKNWFEKTAYTTAQAVPGIIQATKGGILPALGGAATAGLLGQIPPFTALPEEIVTVPFGLKWGFTAGSAYQWYKQGSGEIFLNTVNQGIDPNIAKQVAIPAGVMYAAAEFVFSIIPGMPALFRNNPVISGAIRKTALSLAKQYAKGIITESAEEFLQTSIQEFANNIAVAMHNTKGAGRLLEKIPVTRVLADAASSFIQSIGPSALLTAPGAAGVSIRGARTSAAMRTAGIPEGYTLSEAEEGRGYEIRDAENKIVDKGSTAGETIIKTAARLGAPEITEDVIGEIEDAVAEERIPEEVVVPPIEVPPTEVIGEPWIPESYYDWLQGAPEKAPEYPVTSEGLAQYKKDVAEPEPRSPIPEVRAEEDARVRLSEPIYPIPEGREVTPGERFQFEGNEYQVTEDGNRMFKVEPPPATPTVESEEAVSDVQDKAGLANEEQAINESTRTPRAYPSTDPAVRGIYAKYEDLEARTYERRLWRIVKEEAATQIEKRGGDDVVLKEMADGQIEDTDTGAMVGKDVFSSKAAVDCAYSDNPASINLLVSAMAHWTKVGRKIARALAARRDPKEGPSLRRTALMSMLSSLPDDVTTKWDKLDATQRQKAIDLQAERLQTVRAKMQKAGLDLRLITDDQLMDDVLFSAYLRQAQANRASRADKVYEYWRNSILSGILTNVVNAFGNLVMLGTEFVVQRPAEALFNSAARKSDAPTFESIGEMYRHILPSLSRAGANLIKAWSTEQPTTSGMKVEEHGVAIPGLLGRIVRVPQRAMLAVDEWFKTIIQDSTRADYAIREANKHGLTGTERDEFIQYSMSSPESEANQKAFEESLRLTWQSTGNQVAEVILGARRKSGGTGWIFKFLFPFVTTPTNIITTGLRKSPLGTISLLWKGLVTKGYKDQSDLMVRDTTEQILTYATLWTLYSLSAGDDEHDPWMTGSVSAEPLKRRFQYRNIPPQSVRIGNRWYSYARVEPFATIMTTTIDALDAWRRIKEGRTEGLPVDILHSLKANIRDKTFLQMLGDVLRAMEDDMRAWGIVQNFASSWMPNIVRQSLRASDPYVRDFRARQKGLEQTLTVLKQTGSKALPVSGLQPMPKYDYWGRPTSKETNMKLFGEPASDILYRMVVPLRAQMANTMTNFDRMIWNWNRAQTDKRDIWWPSLPRNTYKLHPRAKEERMTPDQYEKFLKRRGEIAFNIIRGRTFDFAKPKRYQIEQLRKAFRNATSRAKIEIMGDIRRTQAKKRREPVQLTRTRIKGMRIL